MLSPRERLISIFSFEEPDHLPLGLSCAPAFMEKLNQEFDTKDFRKLGYSPELELGLKGVNPGLSAEFKRRGATVNPFIHYGVGLPVGEHSLRDEWGVIRTLTASEKESRVTHHPLADATVQSLDEYPWPDPNAKGRFEIAPAEIRRWKENHLVAGGWGGDFLWCQAWYMRGFSQIIVDMYSNPEFAKKLFDKLLHSWYLPVAERLVQFDVDMVGMADDVATQTGMIISPAMWRKYIKPCFKELVETLRPAVKHIMYHSDGDYRAIMPDLVEIGIDILNPIQPDCLNPAEIKKAYDGKAALWGALSVQDIIPHGKVEDVKNHVKQTIETLAPGGGFVLATSNNVTQDTPTENFLAIIEAAKRYGRYPIG